MTARTRGIRSIAHWPGNEPGDLPYEGRLSPFTGATDWINSDPLTPDDLKGRVVLVDFWTYTCVNWLRTLPYVRAWAEKYEAAGLTVVGVHTPEFGFEADIANVAARTRALGVRHPVAVDSGYRVWEAYANRFWPAVYLADAQGRVRHHHFGEGEYAQTEMVIQRLLLDAGADDLDRDLVTVEPRGLEVAADWTALGSPETYLGALQANSFASAGTTPVGLPYAFSAHAPLSLNSWDLDGNWTVTADAVSSNLPGARISFRFRARDVNLVMGPKVAGGEVRFRVGLDGRAVGDAAGTDVDERGAGAIATPDTYQLVRQSGRIEERTFEIEFLDAGAAAYCFTFG